MKLTPEEMRSVNAMLRNGETSWIPAVMSATDHMMQDMMDQAQMVADVHNAADAQNQLNQAMQDAMNQMDQAANEHAAHENAAQHEDYEVANNYDGHDLAEADHQADTASPAVGPVEVSLGALRQQSIEQIIATLSAARRARAS